jgi:hypothetical protein
VTRYALVLGHLFVKMFHLLGKVSFVPDLEVRPHSVSHASVSQQFAFRLSSKVEVEGGKGNDFGTLVLASRAGEGAEYMDGERAGGRGNW